MAHIWKRKSLLLFRLSSQPGHVPFELVSLLALGNNEEGWRDAEYMVCG